MRTDRNEKWIVCRVCLNNPIEGDEMLQDIFSHNAATRLDQMLHICAGIPVSVDDNYPDKMCSKCVRCLRLAYKFRMTCQRSHQHLTDMLANDTETQAQGSEELSTDDFATETIIWDCDELRVKTEDEQQPEVVRYVVDKEDIDDAVIYDELVDETGASVAANVIYDGGQQTIVEEVDNEHEYEEFEELTNDNETANAATDDDVADDVLSSDDEHVLLKSEAKRARHPHKLQPKQPVLINSMEKKKGRRPRDKNTNYICDVCGNIYPTQARLTEHLKFHSGVKPHECEICGRGFVQNQQLVRHMNTHTGNRPYKCNFCPAAFADRSTKTKHHRIHTKERPYECDVCQKTFTYSDNLKFHKMIHTGEKPHICDICGKGFVKAYKMRLHRVTHEKRGWKPVDNVDTDDYKDDMSESMVG